MQHAQKFWLDPYGKTWKTSLPIFCSWSDDLPNCMWVVFVTFCTYAFWFTFIYAFVFKFQIRELIGIITSNYRLVNINFISPIILIWSLVFHDTFWTDKVHLSSTNQVIFVLFNYLHFTSFQIFFDMLTVGDHKIQMRDSCIICRTWEVFSCHSMWSLHPSLLVLSLATVYDFFLLMVSYLMPIEFHFIF